MTAIKFGTDGWRGVIAEDFTFANARIVAQAIARYAVRNEDARKGLLIGYDHRRLYPATWLFGGAFLVICDTAARTLMAPTELPVGILTALLGGPFFLWLLLARKQDLVAV